MKERLMEHELGLDFLRVVEAAGIASARTMGEGDRKYSDQVAVEAMREVMDTVPMRGQIVIGEGERDEAPMLYIGEKVGLGHKARPEEQDRYPEVDIAVDPLEGTNLCATGSANAISVMACSEKGGLLHAPDVYMQKLVVGPSSKGAVDLDAPVKDNLKAIARRLNRDVADLVVIVLDRPRHEKLIADIREAGARIRLISDGDLSAGISAAVAGSGVHAVMGTGGAPEGVLTAAAMKCLNGQILARLVVQEQLEQAEDRLKIKDDILERMREMGIRDPNRIYDTDDLAPGKKIIFAATGVTDGTILRGIRFFGTGVRTSSIIMTTERRKNVRFIDTVHVEGGPDTVVRF
jgi:fructose-1,6-bisphosphatase class II